VAVRKQPLDFVSYSDWQTEFTLTEEQFICLEKMLKQEIKQTARENLLERCVNYFAVKAAENARQSWLDVEKRLGPYRALAEALWNLSSEQKSISDAAFVLKRIIEPELQSQAVSFDAEACLLKFSNSTSKAELVPAVTELFLPPASYFIQISDDMIKEMAQVFTVAVNRAQAKLEALSINAANAENPDGAVDYLILHLTDWAALHFLPRSSYSTKEGYDPSLFAHFLLKLQSYFPSDYQSKKHRTPGGMAAKIRRVREERNARLSGSCDEHHKETQT